MPHDRRLVFLRIRAAGSAPSRVLLVLLWLAVVVGAGLGTGCGRKGPVLIPVSGLVTLDGKPLPATVVEFEQERGLNMATGITGDDGRFVLTTYKIGSGATPGMHRVQLSCRESDSPGKTVWHTPKHYASFETSGLTAEVSPSQHTFTFELKSQGTPVRK
ncbi:MAG: hypothetical protein EBX36_10250 [Planctomycetia bacterium]|nr:hypothetical protein [Planctomycetia bacterium]